MTQSTPPDTLFAKSTPNSLIAKGTPDRLVSKNRAAHSGSPEHHFELVMQWDGNLVIYLYDNNTNTIVGHGKSISNTAGSGAIECILQDDGNFVLYNAQHNPIRQVPWPNTATCGVRATMQNDGNFVIYGANDKVCWASNTVLGDIIGFFIGIVIAVVNFVIAIYRAIVNWLSGIFSRRR